MLLMVIGLVLSCYFGFFGLCYGDDDNRCFVGGGFFLSGFLVL